MTDRPILFQADMVRAILDGRKTMTRRPLRIQPLDVIPMKVPNEWVTLRTRDPEPHGDVIRCRFGGVGDRLWVRETWGALPHFDHVAPRDIPKFAEINYAADGPCPIVTKWRPSIFMPRWASRITLEIVNVRCERVQSMPRDDAFFEGVSPIDPYEIQPDLPAGFPAAFPDYGDPTNFFTADPVMSFASLWDKINAKRGFGWDENPYVWVVEFRKVTE